MSYLADYVTTSDLKASLELAGTSYVDRDIERALPSASRAIDKICGRAFGQDTTAVARYYTADTPGLCLIGDVMQPSGATVTPLVTVAVDLGGNYAYATTWTLDSHYRLEPGSAPADSEPYTQIRALLSGFPCHSEAVKVTARFGWAEIPDQVVQACVLLANRLIIRARQAPFGVEGFGLDAGVAMRIARTDPDVMSLLDPFRKARTFL